MPSCLQLGPAVPVLTVLSAALLLFAGCANGPGKRDAAARARGSAQASDTVDYSDAAVAARTQAYAHYSAAVLHDLNEEPEKAAHEFHEAAMANPADEALVLEASQRLLQLKQREQALEILKKAIAVPGASGQLYARLGLAYSFLGKKDLAIEADRLAIKKSPHNFSGYQYLAQVYLQNREIEEGLKILDSAAKQPDTDASFLIELADVYLTYARGGATNTVKARAADAYKRAAEQKPENPFLLQRMADGLNAVGESELAAQAYLALLEKYPEAPGIRDRLIEIYLRNEDRAKAAEQLRAVVRDAPTNPQAQFLLGTALFEDKNAKEAAECFKKTILLSPNFEPAYYDLALVQINLNQPQAALATLRKAREKFQQNFVGEFYAGLAYGRMKDYTNSLHYLTSAEVIARATATNRLTHTLYFQLGAASERNQRFDDAEQYFRKALEQSPNFAEALNYLGYMWADRGRNLPEARKMIEKALKLEPENGAFLDSMGWVLFKLNEPEDALKYLLQAIERAEEPDATLYDHLGDVYAALKQTDKARESWQKAMAVEPNEIKDQLQRKLSDLVSPAPGSSSPH
jgi:tetratricopeptide (TPR) repeat protein